MRSSQSNDRFQRRTRPKKEKGFYGWALFVLNLAAVLLSISMMFLSWLAIQKDNSTKEHRRDFGPPHIEKRSKEPLQRIEIDRTSDDRRNKVPVAETKIPAERIKKVEVAPLTPLLNDLPAAEPIPIAGTKNSDIYQPPKAGRRLLTYSRFGGRLNNQLFQFITSLQHAKVLKRTFVVPNEVRDVDWTGMFDTGLDIWDLDSLNNAYDIDWTTGLSTEFVLNAIPPYCVMTPAEGRQLLNGGPKLWEKWDTLCPDIINIAGSTGLLFCEQQHQFCGDYDAKMVAFEIYQHIKLSPALLQYIPSKREEFKNKGFDKLAIHSRRAGEGGYDWELCVNGNTRTCSGHLSNNDKNKFCDVRTMKGNCAAWLDLDWQIKSKIALRENQKDYKFVLASDGTHDWNIDFKDQFLIANNTDWLLALEKRIKDDENPRELIETMAVSAVTHSKLSTQTSLLRMWKKLDGLTATLLELFSLVDSKYLVGAYYSTFSLNACYFRGLDRIYDSNMCYMLMHPNTKHAVLPPSQETVNMHDPNQDHDLPAALMSDVEHAFVRSDDGKFIAIDRYLIQHNGKHSMGILGDGLLPISIVKNNKGEDAVLADFTCFYGDQESPATVILMKGNLSYNEHYYRRGEKYNTPFSTNGDRFRTMIVLCEKLKHDKSLSRHPPLVLKSPDGKFSLSIGSTFQRPVGQVMKGGFTKKHDALVHCLNPAYGLKDPRWVIEYLEYHRSAGVAHVHVYNVDMHSPEVQSALQIYRDEKFITRHDWSGKASGGYTTKKTYEHAKWAAQTDCALRSRGIYDYALFSDLDEIVVGGNSLDGHLGPALEMCQEAKEKRGKQACSFNSNTVSSIYTKLNEEEERSMIDKLILERYDRIEAKPHCPANCKSLGSVVDRKFHSGRQKYIANVRDLSIPPRPMWTHALARDYEEMGELMEVLPDEVMHVRHYQGHWYKNNDLLNSMEEKEAPLSIALMDTVRSSIGSSRDKQMKLSKKLIYEKARETALLNGVEWIIPVERPDQYHRMKMP